MAFEPTAVLGPENINTFSGPASLAAQQPAPLDFKIKTSFRIFITIIIHRGILCLEN
jgi:hypothetical protein